MITTRRLLNPEPGTQKKTPVHGTEVSILDFFGRLAKRALEGVDFVRGEFAFHVFRILTHFNETCHFFIKKVKKTTKSYINF